MSDIKKPDELVTEVLMDKETLEKAKLVIDQLFEHMTTRPCTENFIVNKPSYALIKYLSHVGYKFSRMSNYYGSSFYHSYRIDLYDIRHNSKSLSKFVEDTPIIVDTPEKLKARISEHCKLNCKEYFDYIKDKLLTSSIDQEIIVNHFPRGMIDVLENLDYVIKHDKNYSSFKLKINDNVFV